MFPCCFCHCCCCCWSRERKCCIDLLLAICSLFLSLFRKLLHFHFISFKMHVPFDNVLRPQTTPTNGRTNQRWMCTAAHIGYKIVLMQKSTSLNTRPCSILFAHTAADVCACNFVQRSFDPNGPLFHWHPTRKFN